MKTFKIFEINKDTVESDVQRITEYRNMQGRIGNRTGRATIKAHGNNLVVSFTVTGNKVLAMSPLTNEGEYYAEGGKLYQFVNGAPVEKDYEIRKELCVAVMKNEDDREAAEKIVTDFVSKFEGLERQPSQTNMVDANGVLYFVTWGEKAGSGASDDDDWEVD